jgi:hypothetical protein
MKQSKRATPYEGDDIKDFINDNKAHRTLDEAFRTAKYAEWFEHDPEMSDMKRFCGEMLFICTPILAIVIYAVILLLRAYP